MYIYVHIGTYEDRFGTYMYKSVHAGAYHYIYVHRPVLRPVRLWMPDATTSLEEQVDVMLNTSILVTPGGGGAFSALFLAKGSRLVVWPYAWASEELHFRTHMQWLDSVDFWAPRGVNGGMQQTGTSMRITYPIKDILRIINESRTARTRVTP